MKNISYNELSKIQKELLKEAEVVREKAYNPYSGFFVGAALLTPENLIIGGANVENAAYGSSICAERSALLAANAKGYRVFSSLAIIARGPDFDTTEVTAPCGSCRQMLYESSQIIGQDLEIILSTTNKDKIIKTSINELLPLAFGPLDVGINVNKYR